MKFTNFVPATTTEKLKVRDHQLERLSFYPPSLKKVVVSKQPGRPICSSEIFIKSIYVLALICNYLFKLLLYTVFSQDIFYVTAVHDSL